MTRKSTTPMTYASANDWAALSPVVFEPEIFFVSRLIRSWARPTRVGSTPWRSRRAATASRASTSCSSATSRNDDTLEARYSAVPVSPTASVTMRKPSSCFAPTSWVREPTPPAPAGTRVARKISPWPSSAATRAPNAPVVPSTTAMRRVPPAPANSTGTTIIPPKNTGPSSAEIQNHLLRTRSTNSRRMTAQTLRTRPSRLRPCLARRRVRPHQVDEDLVQRRLAQLEPRQPGSRTHQSGEQALRVGVRCELELGILAVIVHLLHNPLVREQLGRRTGSTVKPYDEMVSGLCPLDVGKRTVHKFPAAGDDAQLIAQFLGLLHDVRRKQDRDAVAPQFHHGILHDLRVDGIEPGERLVQHDELRPVPCSPNSRTDPSSGSMTSMIIRMVVVLPAPFGPSSP